MAGTIVSDTVQDGTGNSTSTTNVINGCAKAWVNFNGTTGATRTSYNVSSVTRSGSGAYSINFTTSLADANYVLAGTASSPAVPQCGVLCSAYNLTSTTSVCYAQSIYSPTGAGTDYTLVSAVIFR